MAEKEQVIQALRATLLSVKGALTLKQCNRKYHDFILKVNNLPFKQFPLINLKYLKLSRENRAYSYHL